MRRVHGTIPEGFHYPVTVAWRPLYPIDDEQADRAYCVAHGLVWGPRVPFNPFRRAPHPQCVGRELRALPQRIKSLPGQIDWTRPTDTGAFL